MLELNKAAKKTAFWGEWVAIIVVLKEYIAHKLGLLITGTAP